MTETIEQHLEQHGVRPTSVRILVWREIESRRETFSLGDLERSMPAMDRSSIFRTLRLFAKNRLLHELDDGTGQKKYCVCRCTDQHHLNHIHFTCQRCGQTFCLEDCHIPPIPLPEGFVMSEAEFVIKGVCPACR